MIATRFEPEMSEIMSNQPKTFDFCKRNISSKQLLENAKIALTNASNKVIEFILRKVYEEDCLTKASHLGKNTWNHTFAKIDKFDSIDIYDILSKPIHREYIVKTIEQELNEVNNNVFQVDCHYSYERSSINIFWFQ